jgi:hypothetical protein
MIKLKEYDYRLLNRVSEKLSLKIDIKEIDDELYIKNDDLLSILEELYDCNGYLEERIQDMEQEIQDNYRPIQKEQQL